MVYRVAVNGFGRIGHNNKAFAAASAEAPPAGILRYTEQPLVE